MTAQIALSSHNKLFKTLFYLCLQQSHILHCTVAIKEGATTSLFSWSLYLWTLKLSCPLENIAGYQPCSCPVATRPASSPFGNPNLLHPTLLRGPPTSHHGTKEMDSSLKHHNPSTTSIRYPRKPLSKSADTSPSQYHDLTSSVALYVA